MAADIASLLSHVNLTASHDEPVNWQSFECPALNHIPFSFPPKRKKKKKNKLSIQHHIFLIYLFLLHLKFHLDSFLLIFAPLDEKKTVFIGTNKYKKLC